MTNPTQGPAGSNQDKLAGLAQPTPAPSPPPTSGVPPWEGKASEPAPYFEHAPQTPPPYIPPVVTQPSGLASSRMPLAGIWNRTWCWFFDSIVAFIVTVVVAGVVLSPLIFLAPDAPVTSVLYLPVFVAAYLSYYAASYRWWGRTPVMMIPRLYVVDEASGEKLSWMQAYLRSFFLALGEIIGIVALIYLIVTANNPAKQGPHDKIAKSLVVQRPR